MLDCLIKSWNSKFVHPAFPVSSQKLQSLPLYLSDWVMQSNIPKEISLLERCVKWVVLHIWNGLASDFGRETTIIIGFS
jgi:hypothetical protein